MMNLHVTPEAIARVRGKQSSADEVLSVLRHVSTCADCRAPETLDEDAQRVRNIIASTLAEPSPHLNAETELFPYVDGSLGPAERELVVSHIEDCSWCLAEVKELSALRASSKPKLRLGLAVAAGVLVPLFAALILWRVSISTPESTPARSTPPIVPSETVRPAPAEQAIRTTYDNPQWTALVAAALEQGRLPTSPNLAMVRGPHGMVRGDSPSTRSRLSPSGTAIDSTRPRFTWPGSGDASYVITVADDDQELVTSPALRRTEWECSRDLLRGRSYVWQVEVLYPDGRTDLLPAPPEPPARFHIISDREHDELAAAARRYPDDPLLLAVLYSRGGMVMEAQKQIRVLASKQPRSDAVQRLIAGALDSP